MKRFAYIIISVVCSSVFISCQCSNSSKEKSDSDETTLELVETTKEVLADNVLAMLDDWADEYMKATENMGNPLKLELSDTDQTVVPDYLLDPSEASKLVTRTQKVWAMAELICELHIKAAYGMPVNDSMEALTRLRVELNHPLANPKDYSNLPLSDTVRKLYDECKKRNDLIYFWQFQYALVGSMEYIISQNPSLFLSKMSEEQWASYRSRYFTCVKVVNELAKYDSEMSGTQKILFKYKLAGDGKELNTLESSMKYFSDNKDKFKERRNAMLK